MSDRVTGLGPGSKVFDKFQGEVLPVAASDLVAWYPFRSGTGEDLTAGDSNFGDTTDYSATVNGATFEASGGVTDIKTGANSAYFEHDGVDDFIEFGIKGSDITSPFSIMFWWKGTDRGYSHSCFNNSGNAFYFRDTFPDELIFKDEQGTSAEVGTGTIPQNQWAHLAVVVGATDVKHYIDGQRVFTDSGGGHTGRVYADAPVQQGILEPTDKRPWGGDYDGTRIYQTELTGSQINQIYLNGEP